MFSAFLKSKNKSINYYPQLKVRSYILIFALALIANNYYSQNFKRSIDSLEQTLKSKNATIDHQKAEVALLNNYFLAGETKKGLKYARNRIKELKQQNNTKDLVLIYYSLVNFFFQANEVDSALIVNDSLLKYAVAINDKPKIIAGINNKGSCYFLNDDFKNALVYYDSALRIEARSGFPEGKFASINNIGLIYMESNIPKMAVKYFLKSAKKAVSANDLPKIISAYEYLTDAYLMLGKNDSALHVARELVATAKRLNSTPKIVNSLVSIGNVFKARKLYDSALVYYSDAELLGKGLKSAYINYTTFYGLAETYLKLGKIKEAERYAEKLRDLPNEYSITSEDKQLYQLFSYLDYKKGNYKDAYDYLDKYLTYRDSCYNTEVSQQISDINTKYETEKKDKENQLLQVQNNLSQSSIKQQRTIIFFTIGGLAVTLVLLYFIFVGFRKQREANKIISDQKKLVEDQAAEVAMKHKEITDSINYAERIQRSFLATESLLKENLKNHFVFFKPKDIVSGDFYWAGKLKNGDFALVTADSTGHGVPGAIMSILNISSIEKAVEKGYTNPAEILNFTRKTIIDRLSHDGSLDGGKDGMDASLVCFNFEERSFTYAAANNPVWIVRDNQIIELSPDKMPVGKHEKDKQPFNYHKFELQKDDMVYTLTDGYSDQFGGQKSKKFMHKQLKQLLISISGYNPDVQSLKLGETLKAWQGNLEQVDDICIIGVRIS